MGPYDCACPVAIFEEELFLNGLPHGIICRYGEIMYIKALLEKKAVFDVQLENITTNDYVVT